jgi:DNA-binding NarL/FixJ family response regulator
VTAPAAAQPWAVLFRRDQTAGTLCPLTRHQVAVLGLVAEGLENAEIGAALGVTTDTVKSHAHRAFRRIGAGNRAHAVLIALQSGWIR